MDFFVLQLGRTATHYAAPQQNAIYDTLLDAHANVHLIDTVLAIDISYRL
jgi:hypothetical protein